MLRAPTASGDARFAGNGDILRNEFEELCSLQGAGAPVAVKAEGDSRDEAAEDFEDAIAVEIIWGVPDCCGGSAWLSLAVRLLRSPWPPRSRAISPARRRLSSSSRSAEVRRASSAKSSMACLAREVDEKGPRPFGPSQAGFNVGLQKLPSGRAIRRVDGRDRGRSGRAEGGRLSGEPKRPALGKRSVKKPVRR